MEFFDILLEGLQLPQTSFTGKGEIKLSNEQFLSLKVISFCYSPSNYPLNGNLYICLATANNTISIFQSNNRKLIYDLNNEIKNNIVKLIWSPWKGSMSTLCVITALNEIFLLDISETAGELLASNLRLVQPASRFLISQVHWYNLLILLIGSTNAFKLYDDGDNQLHSYTLSKTHDLITGIVTSKQVLALTSFDIHLSFEHGQFECLQYNFKTHKISLTNSTSALQQLVNQLLYKYQLSQSVAIGEAPVNHNYLNDIVEGTLYNYGAKLNGSVIALVTRIVPKNVLNYTILSKIDYRIDFIPYNRLFNANPLSFNNVNSSDTVQSALGWINKYWFNHFNDIPQIKIINEENAIQYCKSIKEFIEEKINFKETDDGRTTLSSISESFTLDPNVFKLQIQYNLYLIVLKTLNLLIEKTNSEELREPINQFEIELQLTQKKIFNKLARIVSAIDIDASQPFDNFVQKSYSQLLDDNNDDTMDIDDSGSTISIRTQFLTESFKPNGESKDVISSTTDHKWKRCNITLLPLLQLNHKTSEIGGFNYIINEFDQESKLLQEILTGLDYCVFSGNRAFKKR